MLKNLIKKIIYSYSYYYFSNGAKIQKPVILLKNKKDITLGKSVFIRKNARIETVTKWKNITYNPQIIFEDKVNIEQNFHLICANSVIIGEGTSISSNVMITDIDHDYTDITKSVLEQTLLVKKTVVGKYCLLGSGVKIMAGVRIGNHCVIGANSVVTHDIPDYCVAVGIPAKILKKYNFETKKWERT